MKFFICCFFILSLGLFSYAYCNDGSPDIEIPSLKGKKIITINKYNNGHSILLRDREPNEAPVCYQFFIYKKLGFDKNIEICEK